MVGLAIALVIAPIYGWARTKCPQGITSERCLERFDYVVNDIVCASDACMLVCGVTDPHYIPASVAP